jgi:hypothetical protein
LPLEGAAAGDGVPGFGIRCPVRRARGGFARTASAGSRVAALGSRCVACCSSGL